jgi:RimJ/RimL family protein N-acetyltransferase
LKKLARETRAKASNTILETERLVLRQFTMDDATFIIQPVNTPGWIEFIGDRNIKATEQAKNYLQNGPLKSYELNGFGLYPVELKNEKTPIGMCGIIKRDNLENPDIGFAFLPEFTGRGFAFQIANATMKYAKDQLKLPAIFAITVSANKTSIKLLEKIGMKFIKPFCFPENNEE